MAQNGSFFITSRLRLQHGVYANIFGHDHEGGWLVNFAPHQQQEYTRRILLRCPRRDREMPDHVFNYLYGAGAAQVKFSGGLSIGGGLDYLPEYGSLGVVRLGGIGKIEVGNAGGPPGPDCPSAGLVTFGVAHRYVCPVNEQRWHRWPVRSSAVYTVTVTIASGGFGSGNAYTGTCAALTNEFTLFASGSDSFGPIGSATIGFFQVKHDLIGAEVVYDLRVDETF